jgi:hypothetical protein
VRKKSTLIASAIASICADGVVGTVARLEA